MHGLWEGEGVGKVDYRWVTGDTAGCGCSCSRKKNTHQSIILPIRLVERWLMTRDNASASILPSF